MSTVGIGVEIGTIVLLVGLAVAIDQGDAGGLIARYQTADLPPEKEDELARDVRNLLLVASLSVVPLLVHFTVAELPAVVHSGILGVVPLVLIGWLF